MKRLLFSLVLLVAGSTGLFASWIPSFNQDFIIKNVLPSTRGGIYPTDIPEFQQVMQKHEIIPLVRKYRVNLQMGKSSLAYGRYYLTAFTREHLTAFERYIISVKNVLLRYTPEFVHRLQLTVYLVHSISGSVAGLACGREVILGSASSQTLHHELGHVVNNTYPELDNQWKGKFWADGQNPDRSTYVSTYAMTSYREDFAESFGALLDFDRSAAYQYYLRGYPNINTVVAEKILVIQRFLGSKEPLFSAAYWDAMMNRGIAAAFTLREQEAIRLGRTTPGGTDQVKAYYARILIEGVTRKDTAMVRQALENGADPNTIVSSWNQWTALHYATRYGLFEIVDALIRKGADPNRKDSNNQTAIDLAGVFNQTQILALLKKGDGTGSTGGTGTPPRHNQDLITAAQHGDLAGIRKALAAGARPDYRQGQGWTALLFAANHKSLPAVQLLVDKGANVNYREAKGWTALLISVHHGEAAIVKYLLDKGANRQAKTSFGDDALALARRRGHTALLSLLGDKGTGDGVKDKAHWNRTLLAAAQAGDLAGVKEALEKGADINTVNNYGWTPLLLAVYKNSSEIVSFLLSKGADKNRANSGGYTPLKLARYYNHTALITLLDDAKTGGTGTKNWNYELLMAAYKNDYNAAVDALKHGADVNARSQSSGWRAVHYAAYHGNITMMTLLVGKGADLSAATVNGATPLSLAEQYQRTALASWLKTKLGQDSGRDDGSDNNNQGRDKDGPQGDDDTRGDDYRRNRGDDTDSGRDGDTGRDRDGPQGD